MAELRRQIITFTFYRAQPEWRRVAAAERAEHRREFAEVIHRWNAAGKMRIVSYSTVGTRAESQMMLWRICYSLEELQNMSAELLGTRLGGYLRIAHNYLGMTKRSRYMIQHETSHQVDIRAIRPGEHQYLFLMPLVKTAAWYSLDPDQRQLIINDQLKELAGFPRVKLNIVYSFGMDDQDYLLAYESDFPQDVADVVQATRETESNRYNHRDIPVFTCVRTTPEEMLGRLG
ncbi:MAG: chlorite dismutase family protein [Acidobacteria bacterium]|nr:chlorite dismutase family protein [Acidobacteriota bacterium]